MIYRNACKHAFCLIFCDRDQKVSIIRCSRPLCSSQSTGGAASVGFPTKRGPEVRFESEDSVRSLRTQQRACAKLARFSRSSPKGRTNERRGRRAPCQMFHPEHQARTFVSRLALGHRSGQMLLRKEVIQPHLPVRLPCYDLVLITDPTFDSSLLAVGPLASGVTDFHDLTGGVYKARERIHRSVADLRLLATPTS